MAKQAYLQDLNDKQREAVTFRAAPLLVMAGPGSGKTRIITHRIAWLIAEKREAPENILAITFTNRAAEEMRERLNTLLGEQAEHVWIHTFHAAAMRMLRKFGHHINIATNFTILDDEAQRQQIIQHLRQLNLSSELHTPGDIIAQISKRKTHLQNPREISDSVEPEVAAVIQVYEKTLREQHMLDFDDLLRFAVLLLRENEQVRDFYRATLRHILIDEYQDINQAQYELITLLAPPVASLTAVADPRQTIYGWRGSSPDFVDKFKQRYNPTIIQLLFSYRCPPRILYGAQSLVTHGSKKHRGQQWEAESGFLQSQIADNQAPIYHYIFRDIAQEQQWLVTLIQRLIQQRGYKPGDIAILYRTHRLAGPVEQSLLQAGLPVQRVRPKNIFERRQGREIIRYLQLARALTEQELTRALNYPVHQIDELTMVQLKRLAQARQSNLVALMQQIDNFPEISPLTRHHLRRMMHLAAHKLPGMETDVTEAVQNTFIHLSALRSPWRNQQQDTLARFMDATRTPEAISRIKQTLAAGQPLAIRHDNSLDGRIASFIFSQVLQTYLGIEPDTHDSAQPPEQALVIFFGDQQHARASHWLIPPHPAGPASAYSIWAWRWAQQLLISYENLAAGRFVAYDIETTGTSLRWDEIIEIGAWAYENGRTAEPPYRTLIRPQRKKIPKAATRVHGIRDVHVANAPDLANVLPDFLDYIGDDTLIGHNIAHFDNRFIDKACGQHLGTGFYPLFIDTLPLARRLLPGQRRYTLEHLSNELNLHRGPIRHRALDDLKITADLFYLLTEYLLLEKEQEALSDYLPLLALSLLASPAPKSLERELLLDAAARMMPAPAAAHLLDACLADLPAEQRLFAMELARQLEQRPLSVTPEDDAWNDLQTRFLKHVQSFRDYGQEHTLRAFLDYQALLTNLDVFSHERRDDAITMMTLHNAKGAEFPVVIIVGVEQENLPIWRSLKDKKKLDEERRVFFVGLTRAQQAVYLFSTNDRGDGFIRNPSRFTFEIPHRFIRHFRIYANGKTKEIQRVHTRHPS